MKILAIEFSTNRRSVAVVEGPAQVLSTATQTEGRATNVFALIEQALAEARVEREQIDALAIGLGPGSYTGIRVAISVAQGWQLAQAIKLVGISSVEVCAAELQASSFSGLAHVVIDAQRGEYYLATYEIDATTYRETAALRLVSPTEVEQCLARGERVFGPELSERLAAAQELYPSAGMLGRVAVGRGKFVAGEQLEPIYLRETSFVKAPPPRTWPAT